MSWWTIAAKDVRYAVRSLELWLLVGFLVAVFGGYTYLHEFLGAATFLAFLDGLVGIVALVVPLVAIFLGYRSIAHERTSGRLTLTLSLPQSRLDALVGTVVGRSAVLLGSLVVVLGLALAGGAMRYGTDGIDAVPLFLGVTALYTVAFVSVAVGVSMITTADRWLTLTAIAGYLLLVVVWETVQSVLLLVLHRFDPAVLSAPPDWALWVRLAQPTQAYYRLLRAGAEVDRAGQFLGENAPMFVDWWMAGLLLVAWTVVPLAVGYARFSRADL